MSESNQKAYYTLEQVKNEVVRPGRLFSLGQCVEIVKNLSGDASQADIHEIAGVILKDISLTTRVLQVANSIEYNRSGKRIVTVSQGIMVLGLAPIRSIAYSILLLEQLPNHAQAVHIRNACLMSVMSGSLARLIAEKAKLEDPEQGFITAAFTHLGRILVSTFLPDEEREIDRLIREESRDEDDASRHVLGLRTEQFGKQIGEFLNLPGTVTSYMDPFNVSDRDLPSIDKRLLQVTLLSHRVCRAIERARTGIEMEDVLRSLSTFKESGLNGIDLVKTFKGVVEEIGKFYAVRPSGHFWSKAMLLCQPDGKNLAVAAPKIEVVPGPDLHVFQDGVMTVTELLAQPEFNAAGVWSTIAETFFLGFKARNVVVSVSDLATPELITSRAAYGLHAVSLRAEFAVDIERDGADLTGMSLRNGRDMYIENANESHIREHLPRWIVATDPKSFFLLPVLQEEKPVGLIYVDGPLIGAGGKVSVEIQREIKILRRELVLARRLAT